MAEKSNNISISSGLGFALLMIFFWDEPDIHDVIIEFIARH